MEKVIKLDKFYTLKPESQQWVLNYKKETVIDGEDKPKISENTWYCSTLNSALKRYLDESLKKCESVVHLNVKLNDVLNKINDIKWRK